MTRAYRANRGVVSRVLAMIAVAALLVPTAAQITCGVRTCCAADEMQHTHATAGNDVTPALPDTGCASVGACSISTPGLSLAKIAAVPTVPLADIAPTPAPSSATSHLRALPTPPPRT